MSRRNKQKRFEFGKNWQNFLLHLNDTMVAEAEKSLKQMLEIKDLVGKSFLDIGSGSGIFSLAARNLGARVRSFDYDPQAVACTEELKRRYFSRDENWLIEQGNVLDAPYLNSLGKFDIVYAWGVLHHTGKMWQALDNVEQLVTEKGELFISIYNNQGRASHYWRAIKRAYNHFPKLGKIILLGIVSLRLWGPTIIRDLLSGRPFHTWHTYHTKRGMSPWHDVIDWVGGYPFEVAQPEEIFDFFRRKGFILLKLKTCGGGHGCNEFVFEKART